MNYVNSLVTTSFIYDIQKLTMSLDDFRAGYARPTARLSIDQRINDGVHKVGKLREMTMSHRKMKSFLLKINSKFRFLTFD